MMSLRSLKPLLFVCIMLGTKSIAFAQADQIEHTWYNQEMTAKVQIYKARDGMFYGKITWLKEPLKNGKPKVDELNPDPKMRSVPRLGLLVLRSMKKEEDNVYDDGHIYDPENGKTYSCKITFRGNKLDLRGYIGFSFIGRTAVWTKAD